MTITETTFMLPTKLQHIYDYIHNNKHAQSKNGSEISHHLFTQLLHELHLFPIPEPNQSSRIAIEGDNNSEFTRHIFTTYQQINAQPCSDESEGEYWLSLLLQSSSTPFNQRFIERVTAHNIPSVLSSHPNTIHIPQPRSGFSSKHLSPKSSLRPLTKLKSADQSDTTSMSHDPNESPTKDECYTEIPTDSDLDDTEFDILKQLPTWNKLKLSVHERRQRWRWRCKRKTTLQKLKDEQHQKHQSFLDKQSQKQPETKSETIQTYSDLDFSSHDDEEEDIIKGPSPPPRKMMSAELKAMCGNLINELISSPRSFYFRDYFPFDRWNLPDYIDHFPTNHLHLNIIKQKLENDEYETPGLFAADVRAMFRRSTLYHWKGAKQYRIKAKAMLLSDEFEEKYMDILREDEVSQKIRRQLSTHAMYYDSDDTDGDGDIEFDSASDEVDEDVEETYDHLYDDDHDQERSDMMQTLQQLTLVTDMETIKETNDYINNIRLDLMIAQKINSESPRLHKMRFLKQLHASQMVMERKATDMISYRMEHPYNNVWDRNHINAQSINNSITSRASQTFFRAHDLSFRYAVNFPKSITIKANKKRRKTEELKHEPDAVRQDDDAEDTEREFEQLPTEMTDAKLIEEHTDDLWAAMPLVPDEILNTATKLNGVRFVRNRNMFCEDIKSAERLLMDPYFTYTYGYVKAQFRTHFGSLRVGRDVFVGKLHYIFDTHSEFRWLRLHLPNYYVTPKSILPMDCMKHCDGDMSDRRAELYGLLQILQPKSANASQTEMIYQHKQYLYELLKLSGVIQTEQPDPIPMDAYDEFVLSLDASSDDAYEVYEDAEDHKRYESYSEDELDASPVMVPTDGTSYTRQTAMNAEYDRTHNNNNGNTQNENTNNNASDNNNNNNNENNNNTTNRGSGQSGGDDGDEKKQNDDDTHEESNANNNEPNEEKDEDEDDMQRLDDILQDIDVIDASLTDPPSSIRTSTIIKCLALLLALLLAFIFASDFISVDGDYDSNQHQGFYQQAQEFLDVYDVELVEREKHAAYKPYSVEIPDENPAQSFLDALHVGSLVDALDIENKWYTAYITNIDTKTGFLKIHYDDWPTRFDEWVDPASGKLAPYRTHAIGGELQGGLPGRPLLPIKPRNNSILSPFLKMRLSLHKQQKTLPDVRVTVEDIGHMSDYRELITPIFYDIGIVYNDRGVYMNRNRIYISYAAKDGVWCIGSNYTDIATSFICIRSDASGPELIATAMQSHTTFTRVPFAPAYLLSSKPHTKGKYAEIGRKGLMNIPTTRLNNKVLLPMVIVGTAGLSVKTARVVMDAAAKLGYYMFDTGTQTMVHNPLYFNHKFINHLFQIYGRSTIGVSTKIPSFAHGYHATIHNFISQLHTLDTDYIDLVVMEHPQCLKGWECEGHWLETWRALEFLYEKKRIRALGVSEFSVKQLNLLIAHKQKHIPLSVVRDWRDPLHPNTAIVEWCDARDIQFQAFSPLGGQYLAQEGIAANLVLSNEIINGIATKRKIEAAQVVIKWNMKRNVGVVLRSSNVDHLSDNLDTFTLPRLQERDAREIDRLALSQKNPDSEKEPLVFRVSGRNKLDPKLKNKVKTERKTAEKRNKKQEKDGESVELKDEL